MRSSWALASLFAERCSAEYLAAREFYYTLPGESRRADVAVVLKRRLEKYGEAVFSGAPELVVEILSPSNRHMDVDPLRVACFRERCLSFWVVNLEVETVTVYRGDAVRVHRRSGDSISLEPICAGALEPSLIFEN